MAIKLEDAVAVVQKEIRKWRKKYESVANETSKTTQLWSRAKPRPAIFVSLWRILKKSLRFLSITTMHFIVFSAKMRWTPCGKI